MKVCHCITRPIHWSFQLATSKIAHDWVLCLPVKLYPITRAALTFWAGVHVQEPGGQRIMQIAEAMSKNATGEEPASVGSARMEVR